MRRQGRLRSTLRPNRHRKSTGASSITLPSYSSTAGSKIQLGMVSQSSAVAPPLAQGISAIGCPLCLQASRPQGYDPTIFVWPSREQQQQLLQAQLAAAAVHQEKQQLLQKARDVKVSIARPPHSRSYSWALISAATAACLMYRCRHRLWTRLWTASIHIYLYRNTASSLCIASSACSESPWSFSTRTGKPRQQ